MGTSKPQAKNRSEDGRKRGGSISSLTHSLTRRTRNPLMMMMSRRGLPQVKVPSVGGVILFDLDDTLVVASEVSRTQPIFATYPGYATIAHVGGTSMFVAIRPFALASILMFLRHGYQVGFWSAGSPLYVSAIAERLIDAVRLMQSRKKDPHPFRPIAVVALDQQNLQWIRNETLESKRSASHVGLPKLSVLCKAPNIPGQGIVKQMPVITRHHPHLNRFASNIVLLDNLKHDMAFTLQVPEFAIGSSNPPTAALDKTLLTITRFIMRNPSTTHAYDVLLHTKPSPVVVPAAPAAPTPAAPAAPTPAAPAASASPVVILTQ